MDSTSNYNTLIIDVENKLVFKSNQINYNFQKQKFQNFY
jgi:hypothetical protein